MWNCLFLGLVHAIPVKFPFSPVLADFVPETWMS